MASVGGTLMNAQQFILPALAGFAAGAIGVVAIVYLGIRFNYKNLRTLYAHIPQHRGFYLAWGLTGGVMIAALVTVIPILDGYGIKDPWTGLIMIAICLVIFWPMMRYLKRLKNDPRV